jgi:hypothetical protein
MGYTRHHAIIVTSWHANSTETAYRWAIETFGYPHVSPISPAVINGFRSFVVYPDGSKEGWEPSNRHDTLRADFIHGLGKDTYCEWIEVAFGDTRHGEKAKELLRRSGKDALRVALDAVTQDKDPKGVFRELLEKELGLRDVEVK